MFISMFYSNAIVKKPKNLEDKVLETEKPSKFKICNRTIKLLDNKSEIQ